MTRLSPGRAAIRPLVPVLVALVACAPEPASDAAMGEGSVVHNVASPETLHISSVRFSREDARLLFPADHLERMTGDRVSVTTPDGTLQTRSVREFSLAAVSPGDPLVERTDLEGRPLPGWGAVSDTTAGFLGQLMHTGWVAALPDGGAVFAYALAPAVIRFDADGHQVWRSVRDAPTRYEAPVLVRDGSSIRPDFTEVQHGIAIGPDGRLYLLAGATKDSVRIDVLDRNGRFLRAGWTARGREIWADSRGQVILGSERTQLVSERTQYDGFDLPTLDGTQRIRLSDYEGVAVVINIWASWCGPCRLEMPALDSLAGKIDTGEVVVLGLNDDVDVAAAHQFVHRLGGVRYPLASGEGRLRERFALRGLPYTVVLDTRHRIVEEIYGFGGTIDPVLRAIEIATAQASPPESP